MSTKLTEEKFAAITADLLTAEDYSIAVLALQLLTKDLEEAFRQRDLRGAQMILDKHYAINRWLLEYCRRHWKQDHRWDIFRS